MGPEGYYGVPKNPPLNSVLSDVELVHILPISYFISFFLILSFHPSLHSGLFFSDFPFQILFTILIPHASHMPFTYVLLYLLTLIVSSIVARVKIINIPVQSCASFCYTLFLTCKHTSII
jgi:hypothetical protein